MKINIMLPLWEQIQRLIQRIIGKDDVSGDNLANNAESHGSE